MRFRFLTNAKWLAAFGLAGGSCLPKDTRPVPGSFYTTVTGEAPLLGAGGSHSVVMADGWTVSYDRFLLSIGEASLDGDSCANYYNGDYRRILDMQVEGNQKLSLLYSLGRCDFSFRVAGPETDSLLGQGVSEADKAFMGTPGTDKYATNQGIDVFVTGKATKGSLTKTFNWAFRQRVSFAGCSPLEGDAAVDEFELVGGTAQTFDLQVHGEALFADTLDPASATLRFDPFAAADDEFGNADGEVTLDELGLIPLSDVGPVIQHAPSLDGGMLSMNGDAQVDASGASVPVGLDNAYTEPPDSGRTVWTTFEDYVYLGVLGTVVRVGGTARCRRARVGAFGERH